MIKPVKKTPPPKKTGVNKGIEKGVAEKEFEDRVICKKCGKGIDFTLGSKLFVKCPRCNARVERNLKHENKKANKIIKWDILRRSKKAQLIFGLFWVILGAGFVIANFFLDFLGDLWYLGFLALLPIFLGSYFIMITRKNSASKKYKFYAWLAGWLVLAAIAVTAISVPAVADWARDLLNL